MANKEKIKLTRAEKRQLQALMRSRQQRKKPPHSVQETIPYERMWPDGICRVSPSYYTKTVQFWDINYQLAQNEDKSAIFEGWCDFLNAFDSSVHLQLSFLNLTANADAVEQRILLPDKADGFDAIRREYTEMLQNQLANGSNGLSKRKYLTFGVESENYRTAKPRLERMETDLLNHFKRLGAAAAPLDGRERLKLMYDMFHLDAQIPFLFDWKWLAPTGLRTKDFIVPSSFKFGERQRFDMGSKVSAVSFFSILASELNDRCLAEFLAMDSSLVVSFHLQAIDQTAAIKDIKHKLTALDQMKIDEQKKAVRAGYDMEILPSDLAAYGGEAKKLLEELQNRNERFFLAALLLAVMSSLQSCTPLAQSVLESIVIGTYPAEEADVKAAESAYAGMERQLKEEMSNYARHHPEYDEVQVDADEIWHDPYVLMAIISACFDGQDWTLETAMPVLDKYFKLQYIVTESVTKETRYRMETEQRYNPETERMETVTVRVPYAYTVCHVRLENKNLSHLPVVSMSHHTMGMYALYMATHGNMEGIFHGNPYAVPLKDPMLYDIPDETLASSPTFAALMAEAEKYIGYPYVWGGASPETSFDCSGFVSYVFTNSGVYNTGRLGAKGLRSLCRNVPAAQAEPGDVVFFEGTMGDAWMALRTAAFMSAMA